MLRESHGPSERSGISNRIGKDLVFNTESILSVDNQIQMLDACSNSEDPEHDISGEMIAAYIVQITQESSIICTGDFMGDYCEQI